MYVDTGNGYKYLVSLDDFLDTIRERTSYEFMMVIKDELDAVNREVEAMKSGNFNYIEMENEELRNQIDEANSMLQNYLVELEKGKRVNRQTLINLLKKTIKELER